MVEARERIGDWEGDTVHGQNAHLVTLVDRSSRFTLVKRVFKNTKEAVADAIFELFSKVHTIITVTLYNGEEFSAHTRVSEATGAKIYFAKPYASWQRGNNKNTNSRIRRFLPKSSTAQLSQIKKLMTQFCC
nr:IS30 family transposase [Desulfosediminicola flagellatus]